MANTSPKVALAMIVKGTDDEAPALARCLASINGYVDAIYININHKKGEIVSPKIRAVAEQYTDPHKIFVTEWTDNFVKARQFIFKKVPKRYDWLLWLDADDEVQGADTIRYVIAAASSVIKGIYIQYDYAHDEYGNVTVTHWVCRMCRNDGSYDWQASIDDGGVAVHETLVATRTVERARNAEFKVIHKSSGERRVKSLQRNIALLEGMYERQAKRKDIDPRVLYYLSTHYYDAGNYGQVEQLLLQYLQVSGWAEERSEAYVYLGLVFEQNERSDAARQAFVHAIAENPSNPRPYVELGELEFRAKRYIMSEEWLLMAIDKKPPETAYVVVPMENQYRAYMLLAQTYLNMGFNRLKEAAKYVEKALKLRPLEPGAKDAQELIIKLRTVRDRTQAIVRLANMWGEYNEPEKILPLLDSLPDDLQDNPAVVTLRQKHQKPVKWPEKSIAIFCGNSAEDIWGPWQLDEDGMGGSEEAVVQMSRLMTKLGWDVTVYATPGSRAGDYDGVHWKSYWTFNPKDKFDVFIAWRMPWWFDIPMTARHTYLWMHDVMDKSEFNKERLDAIDRVIFVSKYHANLYRGVVPESKWFISANGIDPEQFTKYDKAKKTSHRCVYTSSQVRGLDLLYDIWDDVRAEVPDAELHSYYGWKTFENANRDNPERIAWMENMKARAKKLVGVYEHGRVGHDEIAQLMSEAAVFAYPTSFPEVSCISMMKAICAGCLPVTSDFANLAEYKDYAVQVHRGKDLDKFREQYKKVLIAKLKANTKSDVNLDKVRAKFSWEHVAAQWDRGMRVR